MRRVVITTEIVRAFIVTAKAIWIRACGVKAVGLLICGCVSVPQVAMKQHNLDNCPMHLYGTKKSRNNPA